MAEEAKEGSPLTAIIFFVTLIAVGMLIYSILKPKPPIIENETPEAFMESYREFVAPYIPPSPTRPNFANVEEFLNYFDQESVDFFAENYQKMAYIRIGRDLSDQEWNDLGDRSKEGEAVKYLVTRSPLRGAIIKEIVTEDAARVLVISSGGQEYRVILEDSPTGFKFDQFMGQLGAISGTLSTIELP